MTEMRFDTEKMVEQLEEAGVPQAQARAQVSLLVDSINATEMSIIERCAGKREVADEVTALKAEFEKQRLHVDGQFDKLRSHVDTEIEKLRSHVDTEIEKLRSELHTGLAKVQTELIKWTVSVGILQMALIAALVLKLVP